MVTSLSAGSKINSLPPSRSSPSGTACEGCGASPEASSGPRPRRRCPTRSPPARSYHPSHPPPGLSNPGWDPLQFTIDEAHKRGIEVHAWWNVYKVYGTGTPPNTNPPHVVLSHPGLCKLYDNEWWMDPGIPATKTYLLNLAMEMVRKYDIDAIHFDFIRYPNPDFDDAATYATYGQGVQLADWRRNNITQFVIALYDSVKAVKPRMKVGSAPIGIYKDLSTCNSGWDSYTNTLSRFTALAAAQ